MSYLLIFKFQYSSYKNIIYIQNNENLNKSSKSSQHMKSLTKILRPAKILFPLILGASLLSNPAKAQKVSFIKEMNRGLLIIKKIQK